MRMGRSFTRRRRRRISSRVLLLLVRWRRRRRRTVVVRGPAVGESARPGRPAESRHTVSNHRALARARNNERRIRSRKVGPAAKAAACVPGSDSVQCFTLLRQREPSVAADRPRGERRRRGPRGGGELGLHLRRQGVRALSAVAHGRDPGRQRRRSKARLLLQLLIIVG